MTTRRPPHGASWEARRREADWVGATLGVSVGTLAAGAVAALAAVALLAIVAARPAHAACERTAASTIFGQLKQADVVMAIGTAVAADSLLIREATPPLVIGSQMKRPAARANSCDTAFTVGSTVVLIMKGNADGSWGVAAESGSSWQLVGVRDLASMKRAKASLARYRDARDAADRTTALLDSLAVDHTISIDATGELERLTTDGAVPPLLINEAGRRAKREKTTNDELRGYLAIGKIAKPMWYEELPLARLATERGDRLAIFAAHAPNPDDRVVAQLVRRLRDPDRATRITANRLLQERTNQSFGCVKVAGGSFKCTGDSALEWEKFLSEKRQP